MGNTQSDESSDSEPPYDTEPTTDSVIQLVGQMFNKDYSWSRTLFEKAYSKLQTKIRHLPNGCEEYRQICKYVENTHGPTHNIKVKVRNIFTVWRKGEFSRYKSKKHIGNRKLLWHGTNICNYPSILRKGLLIQPPSNVATNGRMFGNGVYFADVVTKAAQYCKTTASKPYGILTLAEVALGNHYYRTKGEKVSTLPHDKHSVKGLGRYKPDRFQTIRTKHYAQIPLGTLVDHTDLNTVLDYSEYIVYDHNQILFQYLVLVEIENFGCVIQ